MELKSPDLLSINLHDRDIKSRACASPAKATRLSIETRGFPSPPRDGFGFVTKKFLFE
jgi:hypothetical protein